METIETTNVILVAFAGAFIYHALVCVAREQSDSEKDSAWNYLAGLVNAVAAAAILYCLKTV